ncbi:hypothetical protein Q0590_36530 [Rhodocytophaga aerolata]|uniref:Lipocalin-like domain-containing protein n=1 Tax=Rhodocytophaga aerolata TaxID=455078 RepID=A0ABT8RIM8_9BACT|nr:hypothetical protein [Rhodocytophaga aerolata]MDO1451834.1 hypothetical protein [Rhodocytophaga aerolata]
MKKFMVILPFLLLVSCSYYEDGPIVSLRNPEKAVDGDWKVTSYTVNGSDSMWVIKELHLDGKWNLHFIEHKPAASYIDLPRFSVISYSADKSVKYTYYGKYKGNDKRSEPELGFSFDDYGIDTAYTDIDRQMSLQMPLQWVNWEITRLTGKKQMWLEIDHDGKHYELRFKEY